MISLATVVARVLIDYIEYIFRCKNQNGTEDYQDTRAHLRGWLNPPPPTPSKSQATPSLSPPPHCYLPKDVLHYSPLFHQLLYAFLNLLFLTLDCSQFLLYPLPGFFAGFGCGRCRWEQAVVMLLLVLVLGRIAVAGL